MNQGYPGFPYPQYSGQTPNTYISSPNLMQPSFHSPYQHAHSYDPTHQQFPPAFHPSHLHSMMHAPSAHDNDSLFNFDDFSSQNQSHPHKSPRKPMYSDNSLLADHSTANIDQQLDNRQWAIVLEDVSSIPQSNQRSQGLELQQLYEGDKVEIVRTIESKKGGGTLAECKFENLIGLFPLRAMKMMKRHAQTAGTNGINNQEQKVMIEEKRSKLKLNERKKQREQKRGGMVQK